MAGDSRIQGAGPRLSLLDGDFAAVLQQIRFRGASIRTGVFIAPAATEGRAIVENECSPGNRYEVASDRNFRPGTPVMLGSFAGSGEEVIIARAPADKAGAASNPVRLSRGTLRRPAPPPAPLVCPVPITGKTYLAVYRETAASVIHAYLYADGAYSSELGSLDYSAEPWTILEGQEYFRVESPERLVFKVRMEDGWDGIVTWNPAGASFVLLDTQLASPDDVISSPIVAGGFVYFTHKGDASSVQLYKVAVGSSGVLDTGATALGAPLDLEADGALLAPGANLSHHGGEVFSVACFDFNEVSGPIAVPYFSGGAWSSGLGRGTLAGSDPGYGSNGRAVLGSYSLRSTMAAGYRLGLMPHPGSPEVSMLHDPVGIWELTLGGVSISPAGHVAVFPVFQGEEPTAYLLRLPVALPPPGYSAECPPPLIEVEDGPIDRVEVILCRD